MSSLQKTLLFFVLPILGVLLYPPQSLLSGDVIVLLVIVAAAFVLLGVALSRGYKWALLLSIFLQGFNVIIRLMMFLAHAVERPGGPADMIFVITMLAGIILSLWLLLRLDKVDVQTTMIR